MLLHWIIIIYKFEEKINIEKFGTKNKKRFNREMKGLVYVNVDKYLGKTCCITEN